MCSCSEASKMGSLAGSLQGIKINELCGTAMLSCLNEEHRQGYASKAVPCRRLWKHTHLSYCAFQSALRLGSRGTWWRSSPGSSLDMPHSTLGSAPRLVRKQSKPQWPILQGPARNLIASSRRCVPGTSQALANATGSRSISRIM